ncbi:non-hydrolyzing UDP-N-acetylglucosamine 2-epimerase [Actinokineospora bangkokensis]|uniref:UDP-N-acetylglucosamine 2-epimerase (non-hydrolyzing) n=1 Tax=Actinokineospora bangkokensis TaxID=1193682 RepID=A0A1Q9LBR8_9PSEU|nr:UDP-N-acetylglucosamine 2-epimerase (non-hydrolyzing) [Actinokineospora bangkokensis]OLR89468.1 UDP-N-acetylglucosamine 2-epimerase [Actinokineospora bangkokensis]
MRERVLVLVGTRPEAVKCAPVVLELQGHRRLAPVLVHSGQHGPVVEQALAPFGLTAELTLPVRRAGGGQAELVSALLPALDALLERVRPAAVLVQGDTTTALCGALAAFWRRVPVAHLEAGLRTGDLASPFPEEANRQVLARLAALHLAPTPAAADALRAENVAPGSVVVTGNTVVDAVRLIATADRPPVDPLLRAAGATGERLVLVTMHRRESWGAPLEEVLRSVRTLAHRHPDVRVVLPAHPNPAVRAQVSAVLGGHPRVVVTEPLAYPDLVWLLRRSALVITDSGGIQEEAPTFGVPVLVARDTTERREAVDAGCAWLVGTSPARILDAADRALHGALVVPRTANPFGDGHAAARVCAALDRTLRVDPHLAAAGF